MEKALAENGASFEDKHLRVDKVVQDGKKDTKRSVFVGNVNFKASEEDVRSFFKDCGEVSNVRLVRDKTLNIGKGFGFVQFMVRLTLFSWSCFVLFLFCSLIPRPLSCRRNDHRCPWPWP